MSELMTASDVARLARMSVGAVLKAAQRGQIPGARKIGRRVRFSRDGVERYLRGEPITPAGAIVVRGKGRESVENG